MTILSPLKWITRYENDYLVAFEITVMQQQVQHLSRQGQTV